MLKATIEVGVEGSDCDQLYKISVEAYGKPRNLITTSLRR